MSVVSATRPSRSRCSRRTLPRNGSSGVERLHLRERRVDAALELEQARVEDGTLRIGVRRQLVESLAQFPLGGREPLLDRGDDLVAASGDGRVGVDETAVEPLGGGLPEVLDPLGDEALGLVRERLDRTLELA